MSYKGIAEMVLEAQGKLGRVLEGLCPSKAGRTKVLPRDISHKESHIAQSIAKNQEVVNDQK